MKFKLSTSGYYYNAKQVNKLKKLGFTFIRGGDSGVYKIMESPNAVVVEINSLKALLAFQKKYGDIILSANNTIEIYDNFRE